MHLFTRLPITVSGVLPVIPDSDITYLTAYEPDSYDHWVFDKGNSSGLVGIKGSKSLSVMSTQPAYSANYLTMGNAMGKALQSDLLDTSAGNYTMCCVVRNPILANPKVPFGTLGDKGGSLYLGATAPGQDAWMAYRGLTVSPTAVDTAQAVPVNQFAFMACALDFSGATKKIRSLVGGASGHEFSSAGVYQHSDLPIALGNGYYSLANAGNLDFAEFILFSQPLTIDQMKAVYLRSKSRMLSRGIALV